MDHQNNHERFTRLLLEAEPLMLRAILVVVPNRADAREIMQETAVALWRQFDSYDSKRPFVNWAMGFSRIETRRFLARQKRRAQLSEQAIFEEVMPFIDPQINRKTTDLDASLFTGVSQLVFKITRSPTTSTNMQTDQHSP